MVLHREGPPSLVRASIAALDLVVAALFLARGAATVHGRLRDVLAAIPSIVLGGLAVKLAPSEWPPVCEFAFALGAAFAIVSLATLGRSFAILPARRAIVSRGPYALVRHPAYASELWMVAAAGLASSPWIALALVGLTFLSLVPRIRAEEALLAIDPSYASSGARFRLIPGLW